MSKETIPSLTDDNWCNQEELGAVEKVIEYQTGTGVSSVKVTGYVLSGAMVETIEANNTSIDPKTKDIKINADSYFRDLMKAVFRLPGDKLQIILENKSGDLRNKLRAFASEIAGLTLTEEEIEEQKNLE